jgi:hypothetical protein
MAEERERRAARQARLAAQAPRARASWHPVTSPAPTSRGDA